MSSIAVFDPKSIAKSIGSVLLVICVAVLVVAFTYYLAVALRSESDLDDLVTVQEDRASSNSFFTIAAGVAAFGVLAAATLVHVGMGKSYEAEAGDPNTELIMNALKTGGAAKKLIICTHNQANSMESCYAMDLMYSPSSVDDVSFELRAYMDHKNLTAQQFCRVNETAFLQAKPRTAGDTIQQQYVVENCGAAIKAKLARLKVYNVLKADTDLKPCKTANENGYEPVNLTGVNNQPLNLHCPISKAGKDRELSILKYLYMQDDEDLKFTYLDGTNIRRANILNLTNQSAQLDDAQYALIRNCYRQVFDYYRLDKKLL